MMSLSRLFLTFSVFAFASLGFSAPQDFEKETSTSSHFFGWVPLHTQRLALFKIKNPSPQDLEIEDIQLRGAMFRLNHDCPEVLASGKRCSIQVVFSPWMEGYQTGELQVKFKDGEEALVYLAGYGQK